MRDVKQDRTHSADLPEGGVRLIEVMGLPLWALDTSGLIRLLVDRAIMKVRSRVCYVNAHIWNLARRDESFHEVLRTADVLYADGMSLVWASRLFGDPLPARLSSADYVEAFAQACQARGVSVYLLGGAQDVARRAADRLSALTLGLRVVGSHDGYFTASDSIDVIDRINEARPDVLLVGMGSPRQECWSAEHAPALDVPVIWSVGALFDYLADVEPRAPQWMCRHGLEWAFRLGADPFGKASRYLVGGPVFVGSAVKTRLLKAVRGGHKSPARMGTE